MDPFHRETPLELRSIYYPLGFPLHLQTNAHEVLEAAEIAWGGRRQGFDKPSLEVHVTFESAGGSPPAPVYRSRGHLMSIVSDSDNFAVCDYTRRFAFCRLSAPDRGFISYYFLEAIANYSLAQLYLAPIHAACVARDGCGTVLCGPSGAGKTSLAYHLARNGWTFISDNESWVVRERGAMIIGNPGRIRFRDTATALFSELCEMASAPHRNGKMSIEALPAHMGIATAEQCRAARVVLLRRQTGVKATLRAITPQDLLDRLLAELPIYEERVRLEQTEALRRIAALDPVELVYGGLDDALRLLS